MKPDVENSYQVEFPTFSLCYLINGDASSLTAEEVAEVDAWVDANPGIYSPDDKIADFSFAPEFGPPCDCVELTVTPFTED